MGPLLFCLAVHPLLTSLRSDLRVAYMDDVTLGARSSTVVDDVKTILARGTDFGLSLNLGKCEVISKTGRVIDAELASFLQLTPGTAIAYCSARHCVPERL